MDKDTEEFEGGAGGSSISADLIRGHINTIILRSLYDRDKYGYEIINEINEKSHGQYTLKQPTLYSALKRLENQGYIQAYWKHDEVSAGGRRKYFRLTESGREIAETNRAEWEYSRTVIDNLISDRNFDFSQPAPTPVDFKILKQATSRVPVVHGEDGDVEGTEAEETAAVETESAAQPEENATEENGQEMTLVAGSSDTVYIDDPSATEKEPDEQTEGVADPAYSSETEKELSYSESIFSDGTPPASDDFPATESLDKAQTQAAEDNLQPQSVEEISQPQADEDKAEKENDGEPAAQEYVLVEDGPADFEILPIGETKNSPEEFAQSPVAVTANAPDVFLQQPEEQTDSAHVNYMQPTMAEARSAPEVFLRDSAFETEGQAAENPQPATAETESAPETFIREPDDETESEPETFSHESADETESKSDDYLQPFADEAESTPETFSDEPADEADNEFDDNQSPTDEAENKPETFIYDPADEAGNEFDDRQPLTDETENARETFIYDPADEPVNRPAEFTRPPVAAAESAPQDFVQQPTAAPESIAAEPEAPEDEPIYSLPSQSYAQAVVHEDAALQDGTGYYEDPAAEQRRITHENYMRLIAGETRRESREENEETNANNLVYNLRSEQERDYKNLIDRLFDSTINNASAPVFQPEHVPQPLPEPEPEPEPEPFYERTGYPRTSFFDAGDKAAADGLKISTSDEAFAAGSAKQTTYNRGATLFKCSLIVGVIVLLEFTLLLLFRENLGISLAYPIVILVLGMALVLVCGILYGTGYGINVRKPTSLRYIMTMTIITILVMAIILIAALAMGVNWTDVNELLTKMIFPFIIALNIPIFTLSFYLLTK